MVFIIILIGTIVAQTLFPWWTMVVVAYLGGLFAGKRSWITFFSGFFAVFFVWSVRAFWVDIRNDQLLSNKIGQMVGLESGEWLFVFTALIGGVLAAIASLAGFYTKTIFIDSKKKKNNSI